MRFHISIKNSKFSYFYMDMAGKYILKREEKYVYREKADGEKRQERNL